MTKKEIRKRYTRVVNIAGKWHTELVVGVQSFRVVENTERRNAIWFADMLAIAIGELLKENGAHNG